MEKGSASKMDTLPLSNIGVPNSTSQIGMLYEPAYEEPPVPAGWVRPDTKKETAFHPTSNDNGKQKQVLAQQPVPCSLNHPAAMWTGTGTISAGDSPISQPAMAAFMLGSRVRVPPAAAEGADNGETAVPTNTMGAPKIPHADSSAFIMRSPTTAQMHQHAPDQITTPPSIDKLSYPQRLSTTTALLAEGDPRPMSSPLRRRASLLSPKSPDFDSEEYTDDEVELKREVEHIEHSTLPPACPNINFAWDASSAQLVWAPPSDANTLARVEDILKHLKCLLPVSSGHHSQDTCLRALMESNYDVERTLQLLQYAPLERSCDRQARFESWTDEEIRRFESAYLAVGKVFPEVSRRVKTKAVAECINFYYRWKKQSRSAAIKDPTIKLKRKLGNVIHPSTPRQSPKRTRYTKVKKRKKVTPPAASKPQKPASQKPAPKQESSAESTDDSTDQEDLVPDDTTIFIVDSILAQRKQRGKEPEYLVHWEGYSHKENTWEPEANLRHNVLLDAFLDRQKRERRLMAKEKEKGKGKDKDKPRPKDKPAANWGPSSASHAVTKREPSKPKGKPTPKSKPKTPTVSKPLKTPARTVVIWAAIDSGMSEDVPLLKVPCPFAGCSTIHIGLDELESHLREKHSRKKQCVCGRAFISDSSLIQHFKDVLVLDLKNPASPNMFSCTPSR